MAKPNNKVRIIGGKWRSRQLSFPNQIACRPTSNRVRETLFNWLSGELQDARCLDLFAGTGALGFEALSRGARSVVMVEQDALLTKALKDNANSLQTAQALIVQDSAEQYLKKQSGESFDIVFLDPPFDKGQPMIMAKKLTEQGFLSEKAFVYVECEKGLDLSFLHQSWRCLKEKVAGNVSYSLWRMV